MICFDFFTKNPLFSQKGYHLASAAFASYCFSIISTSPLSNSFRLCFQPCPDTSAHTAGRLAIKGDELLDFLERLNVVFNSLKRLRTVQPIAIDETVRFFERLDDFAREAATLEANNVRPDDLERIVGHITQHIRGEVLADFTHPADHRMTPDRAELV